MEQNRLQQELDRQRMAGGARIIDLSDTSFHGNGMRFPDEDLSVLLEDYVRHRGYRPDPKGAPAARRAICDYYGAQGVEVLPDHVLITASTSESYSLLFSALSQAGDNVLLPRPTYPLFEYLVDYSRLESRYYRMEFEKGFRIDTASVRSQIDDRTRFLVLISPNNPTGRVADCEEIDALLEVCADTGTMVISDEVFSEFIYSGGPRDSNGRLPRPAARGAAVPVFTLNGISKMFASPDLKLAWIAVSGNDRRVDELTDRIEVANDTFLSCSSLSQHILPGLFERGGELSRQMRERLEANRSLLLTTLSVAEEPTDGAPRPLHGTRGLRIVPPTGGVHCVIGIPLRPDSLFLDDEDFAVRLLRDTHLYVHPGYFYGIEESVRQSYVVVSFLKERELLAEGLTRLVSYL